MNLPLHRTTTLIGAAALTLMAGLASPDTARAAGVLGQGTWTDTLLARDLDQDGGTDAYYDMVLNITWLRAANTTLMSWQQATDWAGGLNFGGYTDWRLPTMLDTGSAGCNFSNAGGTDCGYNVQTRHGNTVFSEMAQLYYQTLGNLARCAPGDANCLIDQPGAGLSNAGDFSGLVGAPYWLAPSGPVPGSAWRFVAADGGQGVADALDQHYAMAVRFGDVMAPVPEPGSALLMLSGGLALCGLRLGSAVRTFRRSQA